MSYRVGELDQLITFQAANTSDDGRGGQNVTWTNITGAVDVWARARSLSGSEYERYEKLNATAMVAFVLRYRTDITERDRIVWNGENYNIRYIPPVTGRASFMVIEAEKGVGQ